MSEINVEIAQKIPSTVIVTVDENSAQRAEDAADRAENAANGKLDRGGYLGNGQMLKNEIDENKGQLNLKLNISDYNVYFRGKFTSVANLQSSIPIGKDGDYAIVDPGSGANAQEYIWDFEEGWILSSSVGPATTDALPEGSVNFYFKVARVLATTLSGLSVMVGGSIVSTDSVLAAFGKIQKQINDVINSVNDIFQPNTLISALPATRLSNTFTFPAEGYTALISKTVRINPLAFVTTIAAAATDYKRVDLIYFKSDNTLAKIVGTESLTVAPRPDIPADSVAVSFINVFGNVISDPTPVTREISIQDTFGNERFTISNFIRFRGVSYFPNEKLIEIDSLNSNTVYVSTAGNDITGEVENSKKPFLTLDKAIAAIKIRQVNGVNWKIEFLTSGVYEVNDFGTFAWWVETELNVEIVFKYARSRFVNYCVFKGNNLNLTLFPSLVENAFAIIVSDSTCTIDWDFNKLENKGVTAGQPQVNRGIYFASCFIKNLSIKTISITGAQNGSSPLLCLNSPVNDYNINVYNYNVGSFGSNSGSLFDLQFTTVLNSSISIFKTTSLSNINIFAGYSEYVLTKIGSIDCTGFVSIVAGRIEFLNGNVKNLTLDGVKYLTGKATITYDVNHPSIQDKIRLAGTNRSTGFFHVFKDLDLTFVKGAADQSSSLPLIGMQNAALECNNVSIKLLNGGYNWNPNVFLTIIKAATLGTALLFKGDCFFDCGTGSLIQYTDVFGNAADSVDLSTVTEAKNRGTIRLGSGQKISTRYDFEITDEKKDSIDYPNNKMSNTVRTETKNLLVNKALNPLDSFVVESVLTLTAGQFITIPAEGTTVGGNGVKVSKIKKNVAGEAIFKSVSGGCGDLFLKDITIDSGAGFVFDIKDIDGTHAIEFNDVNFENCSSLGVWDGFRQFTGTTLGGYGCLDGITFKGSWSGFKLTNSNIMGFGASGTLFKAGLSLVFSNRFYIDLNLQIATGSIICDFAESNFVNNESLQVINCYNKVAGLIDDTTTGVTFPNITPYSQKAYFSGNKGIKNSNIVPYGINAGKLLSYADDTAAAAGGVVAIGDTYIESTKGYFKKRLS
ncbi:hypothetical protein [Flavobacterium sp. T12S277]|uniref:hypothetical protein n=1 Tax=Flavobacterium sp. T12S277 TaxID=3402752 RepID=UPI003AE20D80